MPLTVTRSTVHGSRSTVLRRFATVNRRLWTVGLIAVTVAAAAACRQAAAEQPRDPKRLTDIRIARDSELVRQIVPPRTTLSALLGAHNVATQEASALVSAVARHFDLRRFRAGQPYHIERWLDGRIRAFAYEIDGDRRIVAAATEDHSFETAVEAIKKDVTVVTVVGTISRDTPSLIEALDTAGERIELSLALADVFSGEIDFNSDLQPGDSFRLVVERATREGGTFAGYGAIQAAEFVNAGKQLRAVRFAAPGEKPGYYDEQGRSLTRFLLKSPLKFDPRVTSAFSRARRHPVLNYVRAHNGVDYAASTGAPVVAVASGVVTHAGWNGGGGLTVKLRHAGGYETEYLHLSGIAAHVRRGARVGQGELLGRAGATGLVTGPHLHYGMKRNGAYVNPVREHFNMPPGEPISAIHLATFNDQRDRLFALLTDPATRAVND